MSSGTLETPTSERLVAALSRITKLLLDELAPNGSWEGELSSSALSTAVATIALRQMDVKNGAESHRGLIEGGLNWLAANANQDGGWGDTIRSGSNISTTALCWATFGASNGDEQFRTVVKAAEAW